MMQESCRAFAALVTAWLLVAIVVARVDPEHLSGGGAAASGAAAFLVSETRQLIGHEFYRTTDVYYHRGARPHSEEQSREDALTRLHAVISPDEHTHLSNSAANEIMPWLLATIRIDPEHIEAWRVAAFYLAMPVMNKYDEAIELLHELARRHPEDHRPLLDLARMRLAEGKFNEAVVFLDRGLSFWRPDPPRAREGESVIEKTELLVYRGLCHEIDGEIEAALECYAEILRVMPGAPIAERYNAFMRGDFPELPPTAWVQEIIRNHPAGHDDHHD